MDKKEQQVGQRGFRGFSVFSVVLGVLGLFGVSGVFVCFLSRDPFFILSRCRLFLSRVFVFFLSRLRFFCPATARASHRGGAPPSNHTKSMDRRRGRMQRGVTEIVASPRMRTPLRRCARLVPSAADRRQPPEASPLRGLALRWPQHTPLGGCAPKRKRREEGDRIRPIPTSANFGVVNFGHGLGGRERTVAVIPRCQKLMSQCEVVTSQRVK